MQDREGVFGGDDILRDRFGLEADVDIRKGLVGEKGVGCAVVDKEQVSALNLVFFIVHHLQRAACRDVDDLDEVVHVRTEDRGIGVFGIIGGMENGDGIVFAFFKILEQIGFHDISQFENVEVGT